VGIGADFVLWNIGDFFRIAAVIPSGVGISKAAIQAVCKTGSEVNFAP
jgi:hypothetical protein